jgi:hypothetical protein
VQEPVLGQEWLRRVDQRVTDEPKLTVIGSDGEMWTTATLTCTARACGIKWIAVFPAAEPIEHRCPSCDSLGLWVVADS